MLAAGLHASRVPQVRAQVLRGELHRVACPSCQLELEIHSPLAYTDFDRFQWVELGVPEARLRWEVAERDALARFDRVFTAAAPVVQPLRERFQVRVVFDLDELRERLQIWDAGLDDAFIECLKLQCVRERPALLGEQRRIRFVEVAPDGAVVLASIHAGAPRQLLASWTVPPEVVKATTADSAAWRAACPELFGRGFVSIDRYCVSGGVNLT